MDITQITYEKIKYSNTFPTYHIKSIYKLLSAYFRFLQLQMGRKEVERWDPPNAVTPKLPFPMWGATSKYVKQNDLAGPVFPVERKNDAATMTPKAEVPETQKSVSYPVFAIEKSAHEYKCDEIADIKLPKLFVGPVLVDEGKSGYVPPKPLVTDQPQINAPVFKGVESACTFSPVCQQVPSFVNF